MLKFQKPVFERGRKFAGPPGAGGAAPPEELTDREVVEQIRSSRDYRFLRAVLQVAAGRGIGIDELSSRLASEDVPALLRSDVGSGWLGMALDLLAASGQPEALATLERLGARSGLEAQVAFALADHEVASAPRLLRQLVENAEEEPVFRSRAAAVLKNAFGSDHGLDYFESALISREEGAFTLAFSAFFQVGEASRDLGYFRRVAVAVQRQQVPQFVATLMSVLASCTPAAEGCLHALRHYLDDRRRATHRLLPARRGELRDFAAFYLSSTRRGHGHTGPAAWLFFLPGVRHLMRWKVRRSLVRRPPYPDSTTT